MLRTRDRKGMMTLRLTATRHGARQVWANLGLRTTYDDDDDNGYYYYYYCYCYCYYYYYYYYRYYLILLAL